MFDPHDPDHPSQTHNPAESPVHSLDQGPVHSPATGPVHSLDQGPVHSHDQGPVHSPAGNDVDLGPPTWIETGRGFPDNGIGADPIEDTGYDLAIVDTVEGAFTGFHAAQVVAFTEFLAGTAFAADEREWLIDAMAREFSDDPANCLEQLAPIANAVEVIPDLEPVERADNRLKALTSMYMTEPMRERLGMAETPVMAMLKAHNPPLLIERPNVVVVDDAIEARQAINRLVLRLGGRTMEELPHLRADMAGSYLQAGAPMKAELAGSQLRLVTLRTWLGLLPQQDMEQLQERMSEVLVAATDLDMVAMQLCFRSTMDALVD